jgi:hypothetical protein
LQVTFASSDDGGIAILKIPERLGEVVARTGLPIRDSSGQELKDLGDWYLDYVNLVADHTHTRAMAG